MTVTEPQSAKAKAQANGNGHLTAAATRYSRKVATSRPVSQPDTSWQAVAWGFWHDTPEVRFAGTWIGNAMGRARLFAGRREDDGSITPLPPTDVASQLVRTIGGGPAGQAQMLTEFGPHLVVAGEGWVVVEPREVLDEWHLVSVLEVHDKNQRGLEVELIDRRIVVPPHDPDNPDEEDPFAPLAIRVWQPSPQRHVEADSPIRSSFVILEELRLLNAAVAAISKSRLTGRGLVFVPQGTKFPSAAGSGGGEDDFTELLMDVAATAYTDPDSAAATVPIIVEVPDQFVGQVQHMTFESDFDALALQLRTECVRRFATGLDTPAEVLLGQGDLNHWGAWAIEDSAIRIAVEPRLVLVCDAFTDQWLRPALEALGQDPAEAGRAVVWYDASDLRPKTNRGQSAIELYDRGEINGQALRRELQFDDADVPSKTEAREQLLERLVTAAPSLAPLILPLLGIELAAGQPLPEDGGELPDEDATPSDVDLPREEDTGPPDDVAPPPPDASAVSRPATVASGGTPPSPSLPVTLSDREQALVEAVDAVIHRALERAGQRYRSRTNRSQRSALNDVAASAVHCAAAVPLEAVDELGLLEDAFDRVPGVAVRYELDASVLTASLSDYCRELITAGVEHDRERVPALLRAVREVQAAGGADGGE